MAILERRNIKINPIDLPQNDRVAIGVTLPFNGPGVFNSSYATKDQVKSNLINLLLTDPGERLMEPNFGVGVRSLLFEQYVDKENLKTKMIDQASIYIPEIEISDIFIKRENPETTPELHTLQISIYYKLLSDRSIDAIEINFS
jgi:phage baseplate assembly protein W|tara:strand:- start:11064 stop:11495 length:432 start_codon:yes stop_codon:yes gene_type:complete